MLQVRDGELTRAVPASQAVIRALLKNALGGSRLAQRDVLKLLQAAEGARRKEALDGFEAVVFYKDWAQREITQRRSRGLPIDDILPHPADIIILPLEGASYFVGPVTREERAPWDLPLAIRDDKQIDVSAAAGEHCKASTPKERKEALDHWHADQFGWDLFNNRLPPSLRSELKDRSSAPGATRPGSFELPT